MPLSLYIYTILYKKKQFYGEDEGSNFLKFGSHLNTYVKPT